MGRGTKTSKRGSAVPPSAAQAPPKARAADASPRWGPDNPHPLSVMKTELVWEGKYDEWGNRRTVDAARLAMPMQRIETIDQPRSEAAAAGQLAMFEKKSTRLDDFRNMLIWGDNKLVMASLLRDFKGKIDLIYIDPPFDVGADFTMEVPIGEEKETVAKDQSALEMVAYRDMWGKGTASFIAMIYDRLLLMRDLLAENGSIYVQCDWRLNSSIRLVLDDVFGSDQYRNEITWKRDAAGVGAKKTARQWGRNTDSILLYTRSPESWTYSAQFKELDDKQKAVYSLKEPDGRRYKTVTLGDYSAASIARMETEGLIHVTSTGTKYKKYYLDEGQAIIDVMWGDILSFGSRYGSEEYLAFPTQKPEALLERIMRASSKDGDLVADLFCGSGTTGAVAEKLGRRWIMADLGRFAVHTARKRLIDVQRTLSAEGKPYRAFDLHNLGRYERQWWQQEALKGADAEHRRVVLEFFRAEVLGGTGLLPGESGKTPGGSPVPLIHGRKGRALCHVAGIDSIFSAAEARAVAKAAAGMGGTEVYCLAWGFEMDLRQRVEKVEADLGVKIMLIPIPREIMEKNRKGPPPWLEVAVLEAEAVYRKDGGVDIKLTRFLPSLAEVPTKELESIKERAVRSGFDFIDFWAVDFEWGGPDSPPGGGGEKPFNHHWQDYRTRKDRSLKTVSDAGHTYASKGKHTACVKVVDVFGCDTSITVAVKV